MRKFVERQCVRQSQRVLPLYIVGILPPRRVDSREVVVVLRVVEVGTPTEKLFVFSVVQTSSRGLRRTRDAKSKEHQQWKQATHLGRGFY